MVQRQRPRLSDLIRKPGQEPVKPSPKRYDVELVDRKYTRATVSMLNFLGCADVNTELNLCSLELTAVQVERLREQPWVQNVREAMVLRPCGLGPGTGSNVALGYTPPTSWGVYLKRKPTKTQIELLYLLGARREDLLRGDKLYELELTAVQVVNLRATKWVKQVQPSVQFHTCDTGEATETGTNSGLMDARKADPGVHAKLQVRQDPSLANIDVFIETFSVPTESEAACLAGIGTVNAWDAKTTRFTAKLSQNQIKALTLRPWIKAIRASGQSRPK